MAGNFDVRDYGAKGDGITDDSAAIKAAIAAAHASSGGGTVFMSAGTYIVSGDKTNPSTGPVELLSGVTLDGEGMGKTIIKLADNFNERVNGIVRTTLDGDVSNVTISDLTIDGNRANNTGHQAAFICGVKEDGSGETQSDITLSRVETMNCTAYGIDPHEITYNLVVEECVSHNNGLDGFVADYIVGGVFRNNIAYDNDRHGFNITTSSRDILLLDNESYGNGSGVTGGTGLVVQRGDVFDPGQTEIIWPSGIRIEGGEYYANTREGILIKLSDDVTLTGASVHDNARAGVRVEGATDTVITANQIFNNSQEMNATYDEVNIRLRTDTAVTPNDTYYSTNTQVTDNTIYSNSAVHSRYGIREEASNTSAANPSGTVASGNTITGTSSGDISIPFYTMPATEGDDFLAGSTGADNLAGLGGNDTYVVNHSGDVVTEASGKGTDTVQSSLNYTLGANVENLTLTGTAVRATGNELANVLTGNAGNNELEGLAGNDTLDGGAGADTLQGGNGNDLFYVDNAADVIVEKASSGLGGTDTVISKVSFTLASEVENLTLTGTENLNATGNTSANALIGNAGNNILDGGTLADRMTGGAGNDTYVVDHTGDVVIEVAGGGIDTVISSLTYTLGTEVENLTLSGSLSRDGNGNDLGNTIVGNGAANILHGMGGNDTLEGGLGLDRLYGDAGNDTFILRKGEFAGDIIEDFAGNGTAAGDTLVLAGFSQAATLTQTSSGNWTVTDGAYTETFRLKASDGGVATLDPSDVSSGSVTPPLAMNNPPAASQAGNIASGNEDTSITSAVPAGSDVDGGTLTYRLVGTAPSGLTLGTDGSFTYTPAANFSGVTTFQYQVVDAQGAASAAQSFDITVNPVNDAPVIGSNGGGASASISLAENTTAATTIAASDVDNAAASLRFAIGGGADAALFAIDAQSGALRFLAAPNFENPQDVGGNNVYDVVVNVSDGTLTDSQALAIAITNVNEAPIAAQAGNAAIGDEDTVITAKLPAATDPDGDTLSYALVGTAPVGLALAADGNVTFTPAQDFNGVTTFQYQATDPSGAKSAAQSFTITVRPVDEPTSGGQLITGTSGSNTLRGTNGNDTINGGSGADSMYGGLGDDTYLVDTSSDRVFEVANQGTDTVLTTSSYTLKTGDSIEFIRGQGTSAVSLTGNELDNSLFGNGAANSLNGGSGRDVLDGGLGKDNLTGGAGNDLFVFTTALSSSNIDAVKDFKVVEDKFVLDAFIFKAIPVGDLDPGAFQFGKQALDAGDRILYDKSTGALFYDADGVGGTVAIQFATLSKSLALTADHFDVLNFSGMA